MQEKNAPARATTPEGFRRMTDDTMRHRAVGERALAAAVKRSAGDQHADRLILFGRQAFDVAALRAVAARSIADSSRHLDRWADDGGRA